MRLTFTLLAFLVITPVALSGQSPIQRSVYFGSGNSELSATARQTLDDIALELRSWPDFDLILDGYTDDEGAVDFNQKLAIDRVTAVSNYLHAAGCNPRDMVYHDIGETGDQQQTDARSRQQNRRVDIRANPNRIDDLAELFSKSAARNQLEFTTTPDQTTDFTTANGTKLHIPAGCFQLENGDSPTTPVTIRVIEAYNPDSWILNNLVTVSTQNALLQTAGMLYVEASTEGQPLSLKANAGIRLTVPAKGSRDREMALFYGAHHDPSGTMHWELAPAAQTAAVSSGQKGKDWSKFEERRYHFLERAKSDFTRLRFRQSRVPSAPMLNRERLRIAYGRKPTAPRLAEPQAPAVPETEAYTDKRKHAAENRYRQRLRMYQERRRRYGARWDKFRKDSTRYENARKYAANMQEGLLGYEEALYTGLLQRAFRQQLQAHKKYSSPYTLIPDLSQVVSNAYRQSIRSDRIKTRNRLRRQLRMPKVFTCQSSDGMRRQCFDPEQENRLQKGRAELAVLQEKSGYNATCDRLKRQYEAYLDQAVQDGIANGNMNELADYSFNLARLGWINIDKFYNYPPGPKIQLFVSAPREDDARIYLVSKELSGVLPFSYSDGKYIAPSLPKGIAVTIVGLRIRDGKPELFMLDTSINPGQNLSTERFNYRSLTLTELKQELQRLNG